MFYNNYVKEDASIYKITQNYPKPVEMGKILKYSGVSKWLLEQYYSPYHPLF